MENNGSPRKQSFMSLLFISVMSATAHAHAGLIVDENCAITAQECRRNEQRTQAICENGVSVFVINTDSRVTSCPPALATRTVCIPNPDNNNLTRLRYISSRSAFPPCGMSSNHEQQRIQGRRLGPDE
ncbi:hypothetical protein [Candidatus Magnetaquicoccus inordinatus]|uniref:hypothetical protein n=1 Tax=Candidatus Magnetaquicoccus inordinatus TaxID=2496818 RepID=UPI00102C4D5C|nr:hypothetical protein [Candidatus Magnetaquicoccus inordinatus]